MSFRDFTFCAAIVLAGCGPAAVEKAEPPVEPASAPVPEGQSEHMEVEPAQETTGTSAAPAVEGIPLEVLNWEQTQDLVKQHPGKVVVMDLWATYCPPCIAEFPNLVQLNREHGDKVACISVSTDYDGLDDQPVESYREKVLKFLTRQEATFQNVLLSISAEELFAQKVEQQSIPIVFVYDQQGVLRGQFPDPKDPAEFTYKEQVLPLVEKLLTQE